MILYPIGTTGSCSFASGILQQHKISLMDHPTPEVTHLLLDVPSFAPSGQLRSGGEIQNTLERLPADITIIGGNLNHPTLAGYRKLDLLQDPEYLAKNAYITGECALQIAASHLNATFRDTKTLILGWGRIGKCLAQLLKAIGASVTVAARKEADRAMLAALGFQAVDFLSLSGILSEYRLVFNTVPEKTIHVSRKDCVCIELASRDGISGESIITARGLPGKYAPESTGRLIAETILRHCKEELL